MEVKPSLLGRHALLLCLIGAAACADPTGDTDTGVGGSTDNQPPPVIPEGTDPGRVTLHRLNRAEYNNTVRDLLGTQLTPADDFPSDDHSYGFDNNADALVVSPLQLELYERAAEMLATEVLTENADSDNPLRDRIVTCDLAEGEACAQTIIETFGKKAYRRPLTSEEVHSLVAIYDLALANGDDANTGLALILRAILTSPHFLFRVEIDEDPGSPEKHPLNDYELASRLSYFLWSSMPDDKLLDRAQAGELQNPEVIVEEVDRMLDDPKSKALVDNFGGQWLFFRALAGKAPHTGKFPSFDDELRASMQAEAEAFFAELIKNPELSLIDLVRANFTFVDARLAQHYGFAGTYGSELTRVDLDGSSEAGSSAAQRGGVLRQGAWLTVTSNPDRTSPVKRGKWILENLLCAEPPPPPPGVEGFDPVELEAKSQKELLEQHRNDPNCVGCHMTMDPLGLAFENYDAIGAWRETDNGAVIEPGGKLWDSTWDSSAELLDILTSDERFSACAVEKTFIYALGRGVTKNDEPYLANIDARLQTTGLSLRDLIKQIATSEPFRFRQGEKGAEP